MLKWQENYLRNNYFIKEVRKSKGNLLLTKGSYGFKTVGFVILNKTEFYSMFSLVRKLLKGEGSLFWFNISLNLSNTSKPLETRMGRGKGAFSHNSAVLQPGRIFFEFNCSSKEKAYEVFLKCKSKLSFRVRFIFNLL